MKFKHTSPGSGTTRFRDQDYLLDTYGPGLKQLGLRPTMPRLHVLDAFHKSIKRHLTAEDIFRSLLAQCDEFSLATVYRTLSQFEKVGLLKRNLLDSNKAYFELNDHEIHHHLLCLGCGAIQEFSNPFIDSILHELAHTNGYQLLLRQIAIQGYCAPCAHSRSGHSIARTVASDATL